MSDQEGRKPAVVRPEVRLDKHTTVPILGIPVTFETNDDAVLLAIADAFSAWHIVEHVPQLLSEERVSIRITLEAESEGNAAHAPVTYRIPDDERVIISTPGSLAIADIARRNAVAWVSRALLSDSAHFRYCMLESMTLAVLTRLDRQPVHAAALTRQNTGLLLAGPSGTGKSTLMYAAAKHGFKVLAEDMVYVQLRPRLRVWGLPGHIHLLASARRHFPELQEKLPTLLANGKRKIAISVRSLDALPEMPVAPRAGLCIVTRSGAGPSLETLSGETLEEIMTDKLEPGFDLFADTIGEAIHALARYGGWRLNLGNDPRDALPLLEEMVAEIGED
jgi:hypothetical protein